MSLATDYLEGVFPIRYETTGAIASALANMVTFGLPEDYYDTYRSRIGAITADDVLTAANAHVKPEQMQVVVVGNSTILQPQIESLGQMTLSVLDAPVP